MLLKYTETFFLFRQNDPDVPTLKYLSEDSTQANIQLSALKIKQLSCVERAKPFLTQPQTCGVKNGREPLLT